MQYELPRDRQWDMGDRIIVSLLILTTCALRLWIRHPLDNDTFFLLSHGRYVFEHGLPTIEPFTFHEGLHFVMQQWLSASIFYFVYSQFDFTGLYVLAYIIYVVYGYFAYKISMLISNNNLPISATSTLAVCVGMGYFIILRPWIFSGLIILLEIYCLELYIYKKKSLYLILIPTLSILLINMHAAIWPLFFLFLVPYIADGLNIRVGILKSHGYGSFPICMAGFVAVLAALLNPYSTDAMTYLYHSYGNPYINSFVNEMKKPSLKYVGDLLIFGMYVFVILAYALYRNGTSRMRHVLLTLATGCMGLSSIRSVQYFFITLPYLAYFYRDFDIVQASKSKKNKADIYTYVKLFLLLILCGIIVYKAVRYTEKEFYLTSVPHGPVDYMLNHMDVANIRLYNDYDDGGFLMFKGFRPFIDPRAEVFLKSNNKKEDILNDYFELLTGRTHYSDFTEKYRFTHFLAIRGSLMDTYLSRDGNVRLLYEDRGFRVFQRDSEVGGVGAQSLSPQGPQGTREAERHALPE